MTYASSDDDDGPELEENPVLEQPKRLPGLLSPPRRWPDSFSAPELKNYIMKDLKGRKVRLSELPPAWLVELVEDLAADDPRGNAMRARDMCGYDVLSGFALYERADAPGQFVGKPHWWNVNTRGLWVDLTPRGYPELVLVESGETEEVPPPSADLLARLESIRVVQAERDRVAAKDAEARRKAERKRDKERTREEKERAKAEKAARKAAKEHEAAERQAEIDRINKQQEEQIIQADPTLRAEKDAKEAAVREEEEKKAREAYEAAAARMEAERLEAAKRAEEEARAEEEERVRKESEEEEKRKAREAAATKAREEKKRVEAEKAAAKAAKAAAEAEARLKAAGGTALCWDLRVLMAPITPHKEAGAKCFGVGDYAGALASYSEAVTAACADVELVAWPPIESVVLACRANAALCLLKLGRNGAALEQCEAALELPGVHGCGRSLLSKIYLRRLTALVEMAEDPLETVEPWQLLRAVRDARKCGLASGKGAPAAKSFAELISRVDVGVPEEDEPDEQTQKLDEVARVAHSAFHAERDAETLSTMAEQLEAILDDPIGMSPSSPCAVAEPGGASLLWAICAGFAHYEHAATSPPCLDFYKDALELLLDRDVPVDMRIADGAGSLISRTPLMYAAMAGSPDATKYLLDKGASVHMRDPQGVTALIYVCGKQHCRHASIEARVEVARLLLDAGARVDVRDIGGQSALMNACSGVQVGLVELLLERGADVTLRHGKGCTAVGVLAAHLNAADLDAATIAAARSMIERCIGCVAEPAAQDLLREEVKAAEFFDLQSALMPIHNHYISIPKARMGDKEAALVEELCKQLGMEHDFLKKERPAKWGNFYYTLYQKLVARIPPAFLEIYPEHPPVEAFSLLTQFSSEAIAAAEKSAERLSRERFGGIRCTAYHPETLREEALVPYRHRGRVPRCMKQFQNLFVLPIRRCISHAVPSLSCLKTIKALGPVVEMGAGSGYWAAMLEERAVDVIAYDHEPPEPETLLNGFAFRQFCDVHKGDASLFFSQPDLAQRTLLLVWPGQDGVGPNDDERRHSWEAQCLSSYMEAGGQTVVYVGEREACIKAKAGTAPDCGVSASREFQVILRTKFVLQEVVDVPSMFYTCDDLTVWKRK